MKVACEMVPCFEGFFFEVVRRERTPAAPAGGFERFPLGSSLDFEGCQATSMLQCQRSYSREKKERHMEKVRLL